MGSRIAAVIFDFNGVLVDDESVHCALFQEVLAQEGVRITERDYHERYLGYDDRGCFDAALQDAGQSADRARLDDLIARRRGGMSRSPSAGCGTSRPRPRPCARSRRAGRSRSTPAPCGRRSSTPCAAWTAAIASRRSSRPRTPISASPTPRATGWPSRPCARRPAAGSTRLRLPRDRGQHGRHRLGQGRRDARRRRLHDLRRRPAPRRRGRRRRRGPGRLHPRVDRSPFSCLRWMIHHRDTEKTKMR